jgi:hypothetical protein
MIFHVNGMEVASQQVNGGESDWDERICLGWSDKSVERVSQRQAGVQTGVKRDND